MNKKLFELYDSKWEKLNELLENIRNDNSFEIKPTNPLLIKIKDESDFLNADLRIMFFGQETNVWYQETNSLESVINAYDDFYNNNLYKNHGGHFWNGINQLIKKMSEYNPDIKTRYVWNDIIKIGKSNGKGLPPEYIYEIERNYFSVIKDEIEILNPNVLLFFTGPYYDKFIKDVFGEINFEAIPPFNIRQLAKAKFQNRTLIRTYHPNYLWRNKIENFYNPIISEIFKII